MTYVIINVCQQIFAKQLYFILEIVCIVCMMISFSHWVHIFKEWDLSSKNLQTPVCPFLWANSRGVFPKLFSGLQSDVFSKISLQTSKWPCVAARCNGVFPKLFPGFFSTAFWIMSWTISNRPFVAAMCRGVSPKSFLVKYPRFYEVELHRLNHECVKTFEMHTCDAHLHAKGMQQPIQMCGVRLVIWVCTSEKLAAYT